VPSVIVITPLVFEAAALRPVLRRFGITPLVCGPGAEAAARAVGTLAGEPPALVLLAGLAGGLKPAATLAPCGWGREILSPDRKPVRGRSKVLSGSSWPSVRVATVSSPIFLPSDKLALGRVTDADFVDTESFWFAQAAADLDIPWAVIRAVSDSAEDVLPPAVVKWTTASGATNTAGALKDLLLNPSLLGKVMRLRKASKIALAHIAKELEKVLPGATGMKAARP